jgi:hypothetical protein
MSQRSYRPIAIYQSIVIYIVLFGVVSLNGFLWSPRHTPVCFNVLYILTFCLFVCFWFFFHGYLWLINVKCNLTVVRI